MHTDELLRLFIDEIDVERIREHTEAIHSLDRWSSYDRYHQTADYVLGLMRDNRLANVRKIVTPADGKTIVGDWLVPMAWDAKAGTVSVVAPRAAGLRRTRCFHSGGIAPCNESYARPVRGVQRRRRTVRSGRSDRHAFGRLTPEACPRIKGNDTPQHLVA